MSKCITVNVWTAVSATLAFMGVALGLAAEFGLVPHGNIWVAFIIVKAAGLIYLGQRLERVVSREIGGLVEREMAAYHLGRSRTAAPQD